jgi:hypothetical protein
VLVVTFLQNKVDDHLLPTNKPSFDHSIDTTMPTVDPAADHNNDKDKDNKNENKDKDKDKEGVEEAPATEGYAFATNNKWAKNAFGQGVIKTLGKFSKDESANFRKAVEDFCTVKQIFNFLIDQSKLSSVIDSVNCIPSSEAPGGKKNVKFCLICSNAWERSGQ